MPEPCMLISQRRNPDGTKIKAGHRHGKDASFCYYLMERDASTGMG